MIINKHDTNGTKPLLGKGELGYDDYIAGGDVGRVYVGTGSTNIPQAKKSEVVVVDGKVDTHVARVDNPHTVTKTQVGLGSVDNTSDINKPISTATQTALDTKQAVLVSGTNIKTIEGQSIVGSGNIDLSKGDVGLSNVDNTADSAKVVASAGKWTTSRDITIGNAVKAVNGAGDVTWTLNEIGAIPRVTSTDNAVVRFDGATGQIQNSAITIDDSGNIGSGTQSFNGFGGTGFKNCIINGDMRIDQRNNGAVTTLSTGTGSYIIDRFTTQNSANGVITAQQMGFGTKKSIKITATTGATTQANTMSAGIRQYIEDINFLGCENIICTLSFKVQVNWSGNLSVNFKVGDQTACYSTFVAVTPGLNTCSVTITLPSIIPTINGIAFMITIGGNSTDFVAKDVWVAGNSNNCIGATNWASTTGNYINVMEVQLEEGSIATPFENRPYGLELSLCQRYYEKIDSNRCNIPVYGTGTGFIGSVKYKVPKRTVPTISLGTASHWKTMVIYNGVALSTLNVQETTAYGFDVNGTSSGGNITAGYAGKIQVNDGYVDNGTDGIFVSAEL